jgi:branched-chain amino acid aminotransferase
MTSLKPYYFPEDGLAEHKTCSYLRRIELLRNAVANGYDDAIGLSVDHMVGEAATANVVVVKNGDAATPPVRGILPGITRQVLVETGAVQERPVREQELDEADEIVLLSAGVGALAAAEYKGRELGSCWAGLADQKLEEAAPRP